ncbi:MAG: hypothetical protein IJX30_01690 [Clostridia bacterium]|nr:hypothetical protein [Clostridia bacterium]
MKWTEKLQKSLAFVLATCSVFALASCGGEKADSSSSSSNSEPPATEETLKLTERPRVEDTETKEFLRDLTFSRGFSVSPFISNTSKDAPWGQLTHGGNKAEGDPIWTMAQWGCTHDMREEENYTFTRDGNLLTYDDGGKYIQIDADKVGNITLGIKGSEEYSRDENGNIRERTDSTENWPHILISQGVGHEIDANAKHLFMEVTYEVTECTSLVDRSIYPLNELLNAAQFQWFVTLYDNDEESVTYNHGMWFGFSMFDTRSMNDTPKGYSAYDGGKEDSTGAYIYMFSLSQAKSFSQNVLDSLPSSVVGREVKIKVDVLPFLKQALKEAKQAGSHTGASVEKLRIGSTNIGWELPGNYDVSVKISNLNMYQTY